MKSDTKNVAAAKEAAARRTALQRLKLRHQREYDALLRDARREVGLS